MLATFVIALREGLEASLIVGIIAAFLRRNGHGLGPMWAGVALAVTLSCAVGAGLTLLQQSLPQAQQEALETVIGVIAIVFVTGMIFWMDRHAGEMKQGLEAEAAAALGKGRALALAAMAFLAVLKEGFETAVFFLATFSAAHSAELAAIGALVGLAIAVLIGWGIYTGGVRMNLGRFFRFTGAFLLLVAAGLCVSTLRTAHEAGWLNGGQQQVMNLTWLVRPGTVRAALITSVLGIPADPRLIEVLGWLAYLVPVSLVLYWPKRLRPAPRRAAQIQLGFAVALAALSAGLFLIPRPALRGHVSAPLVAQRGSAQGSARLRSGAQGNTLFITWQTEDSPEGATVRMSETEGQDELHNGIMTRAASAEQIDTIKGAVQLDFDTLVTLNGGRRPIGLTPVRYPGPYDVEWTATRRANTWSVGESLLDLQGTTAVTVTLSGGGLDTPRTLRVRDLPPQILALVGPTHWQADPAHVSEMTTALQSHATTLQEWRLWARQLPTVVLAVALALAIRGGASLRRMRRASPERFLRTQGARAEPAPKGTL